MLLVDVLQLGRDDIEPDRFLLKAAIGRDLELLFLKLVLAGRYVAASVADIFLLRFDHFLYSFGRALLLRLKSLFIQSLICL